MADVFDCVVIQLPRDKELLHRFYNELMKPDFPIAEELEDLQVWVDQLEGKHRTGEKRIKKTEQDHLRCTLNILVCFDARDAERKKILGGMVFEYYHPSNCVLITYLVNSPAARGQGLTIFVTIKAWDVMRQLSRKHGHATPYMVLCECNDPKLISDADDAFSPLTRLRAFQNAGVRAVDDFQYVQPSLDVSKPKARDMLLAVVVGPMTEKDDDGRPFIHAKHLRGFLADFYTELLVDITKDEDYKKMSKNLETRDRIFLVDFDLSRFKSKSKKNTELTVHRAPGSVNVHIVVVGAGLSGLACARDLTAAGFKVTVVEARHRVGGRCYTGRTFEHRVDLGAAWIHGIENNPLGDYASAHMKNLKLHKNDEQSVMLFGRNGKPIEPSLLMESYLKFTTIVEAIDQGYEADDGVDNVDDLAPIVHNNEANTNTSALTSKISTVTSLQQAIADLYKADPSLQYSTSEEKLGINYFFSQLESLQNAAMHELNAKDYGYGRLYEGGDHLVVSGFHNIAVSLAEGLHLEMSTEVKHVEYSQTNGTQPPLVKVHTTKGDIIECNGVVLTMPIGVWHTAPPSFSPSLPEWKTKSLNAMGAGLFNKVLLHFSQQFWPAGVDYFGCCFDPNDLNEAEESDLKSVHFKRSNIWFVNLAHVLQKPVIVAMLSSDCARALESQPDPVIVKAVLARLQVMFCNGGKVPAPIDTVVTRWGADPFSRCSYSFLRVGATLNDIDNLASPIDNALYFAGEHTSRARFGYADGAYMSGRREAVRIISQYKAEIAATTSKLPSKL